MAITSEESKNDNSILYIREIAKMFNKNNLEISDVISGVRLHNKIKQVGLSCIFFENFLESTNTESYRIEMEHEKFLDNIKRIIELEGKYQIKTEDIPSFMEKKVYEHKQLTDEILGLDRSMDKLYEKYHTTESELKEYHKEQDMFFRYKKDYPKYADWIVPEKLFDEASTKSRIKIDPIILFARLKDIYKKPDQNVDIIKKILNE
ncbi:MAG: hypothetical protein ACRD8K_09595 [Nitrososphaeraceae archaeon]